MKRLTALLALGATVLACGSPPVPRSAGSVSKSANPLGPSYVLLPLPTEDDALLGRMLPNPPEPGRSLEETARANPCGEHLSEAKETPLAATFEDAEEVTTSASAKAMLGTFGFSGDASRATHFFYRLEANKRTARVDTTEYEACCKEKGCGYGYVSALIYGEGEYATGEETSGTASVDVAVVGGASGGARMRVLHKRKVHGWMAAVVTVTDESRRRSEQLGPLGVAAAAGITESTVPETVKNLYDKDKISVEGSGNSFVFKDGRGHSLTENEFVRRYRDVTGEDDLDPLKRRRNMTSLIVSGGLTALSIGALTYGVLNLNKICGPTSDPDSDCALTEGVGTTDRVVGYQPRVHNDAGYTIAGAGVLGTLGFGAWFIVSALRYDGSTKDHYLRDRDAVLYAERYNRALLHRTIKQVQKSRSATLQLHPLIGPVMGVAGQF